MAICKVCGAQFVQVFPGDTSVHCGRCDPNRPKVTVSDLERLRDVPASYRELVRLQLLHDFRPCGDVFFLLGKLLCAAGSDPEEAAWAYPHLQPFAQTCGGDYWCWTSLRTGPAHEPEILHIDPSSRWVKLFAPTFETFLYRTALEETADEREAEQKGLRRRILETVSILRNVDAAALADDLELLANRTIQDYTPSNLRSCGLKLMGFLSAEEARERITRFVGSNYVDASFGYDFLDGGQGAP